MSDHPPVPKLGSSEPLAQPLYQSSVYALPDLDALDSILGTAAPGFVYARDAHPNARLLADQLAAAEGAAWGAVCGSGMAALTAALLSLLKQGDRVVAGTCLYGRTTQLLRQELSRFGVETVLVDPADRGGVRAALDVPTRLLLVETISNPMLRLADIEALAALAHERGCELLMDNTFATPVLCRPLDLGADLVVESLTKMVGGHSDVTLGVVCGRNDGADRLASVVTIWGLAANPFDCWLASRSLSTLALRMRAATANAAALADWLPDQHGVLRVVYPSRPDHPDHDLAQRLLPAGAGSMLCFEVPGGRESVNHFFRAARGVPFSPSLGHTSTTCSHPWSTSHRYASPDEKLRQGISEGLIRLSVGVEEITHIQHELKQGLRAL
jgi:cystathionine beta-lyase/cystathionine gamma-synthase